MLCLVNQTPPPDRRTCGGREGHTQVVHVETPVSGTYTVRVLGAHVPRSPQSFALVLTWTDQRPASGCPKSPSPSLSDAATAAAAAARGGDGMSVGAAVGVAFGVVAGVLVCVGIRFCVQLRCAPSRHTHTVSPQIFLFLVCRHVNSPLDSHTWL